MNVRLRQLCMLLVLVSMLTLFSGCGALISAGIREGFDHGSKPRYAKKGYWGHVNDVLRERRCRCRHHCHCH